MKKFFFFRSSSSNSGNNQLSPPSSDKQVYWEKPSESNDKSRIKKRVPEKTPSLRRSLSSSSAAIFDGGVGRRNLIDPSGSPCSTSNGSLRQLGCHSSRSRTVTPERQHRPKLFETATSEDGHRLEQLAVPSCIQYDSSECSSFCSSNVSNGVVDRYIDGEQQKRSPPKSKFSARNQIGNGNGIRKPPPVFQCSHPTSPTNGRKQKPKSQSFRETNDKQLHFSSRDWVENGFGNESPRKLARHVVERLSQSRNLHKKSPRELDPDIPITVEDIYGGTLSSSPSGSSDGAPQKDCALDELDEASGRYHFERTSEFSRRNCSISGSSTFMNDTHHEEGMDFELFRKFKEAERRAMLFSEELEQENFLQDSGLSLPALMQTVRGLNEERVDMAYEVTSILKDWIADRASMREELKGAGAELDSRTRRLEKEKNELQSALEKELDRRSGEWSLKLERYQAEEHRLRERVRELAEQNVSLQREVSSFGEREADTESRVTRSEQQLEGMAKRMEEAREENQNLQKNLSEITEKYRGSEEDRECLRRNYEDKVKECKDLHRSVTRLQRTCGEQEKTIEGLRGLCEEIQNNSSMENVDNQVGKLRMEQLRLTGLEHALRKEVDSYRLEVDSLRHENINLLHRLKDTGKEGGFSTFKLDQELWNRICCLQNQGLSLLSGSAQLCSKLLEYIKTNASHGSKGLASQFVVECEVRLQGFNRGIENLTKSLSVLSTVLHEKSPAGYEKSHPVIMDSDRPILVIEPRNLSSQKTEVMLESELRTETLLTALLREKLYSKELDLEQLQAELAAAIRGNDILKSEVQNALDTISCLTHKMKDLEIQMIKKEENINQLENELQDCRRELTIVRGILPKVSEERDLMWGEVKQYSEKNMLLNCELNALKKKIEALDEDILLKEGQITILKDALGKPFDLLASPDSADQFLVK